MQAHLHSPGSLTNSPAASETQPCLETVRDSRRCCHEAAADALPQEESVHTLGKPAARAEGNDEQSILVGK
jgi:hypothetical protein